jgi:hypothetical protein
MEAAKAQNWAVEPQEEKGDFIFDITQRFSMKFSLN